MFVSFPPKKKLTDTKALKDGLTFMIGEKMPNMESLDVQCDHVHYFVVVFFFFFDSIKFDFNNLINLPFIARSHSENTRDVIWGGFSK
jgi:hypothetical protein